MDKTIIIVTDLTLWSMGKGQGGPAFTQTIQGYKEAGWEVYLISDIASNTEYPSLDSKHNIVIEETTFKKYTNTRKVGFIFRWLDYQLINIKFKKVLSDIIMKEHITPVVYAYEIGAVKSCAIIAKKMGLPFVTRFQGTVLSQFKNNLLSRIKKYPHYQALSQNADLVIMTDDGTKGDYVLEMLGNKSEQLFLRNGLDLCRKEILDKVDSINANSLRDAMGINHDECMFLTVSRLVRWKRVDRAIVAFHSFINKNGIGKLVIVGDGECRKELESLVERYNLQSHVCFTGSVSHDDVYKYIKACDVFLSLYDLSNVGNPLLEAMCLGKCIITLDVGDTNKVIFNNNNGILLNPKQINDLPGTMLKLSNDMYMRDKLGKRAKEYSQQNFFDWSERMKIEINKVDEIKKKYDKKEQL